MNRDYLKSALIASLQGVGAARWLQPRARRWFVLGLVAYGVAAGAGVGLLFDEPTRLELAVIVGIALAVPFFAYDLMLSYLLLERRDREGEIRVAARIQSGLFPAEVPPVGSWDCAGYLRPARSVGGDYWDVLEVGQGRAFLAVADVSGKGVPAAILMAGLRARLHQLVDQDPDPVSVVSRLNHAMAAETEKTEYATLVIAVIDDAERTITSVNAGHPAGLLLRRDGSVDELAEGGLPVGLFGDAVYEQSVRSWGAGDRLLLFSDGVLDVAATSRGSMGAADLVRVTREAPATAAGVLEAVQALLQQAARGEPEDDITVLACVFAGDR